MPKIKTLVAYWTKYGSTEEVARIIAGLIGPDCAVRPVDSVKEAELDDCGRIIVGSPVYCFSLPKAIHQFLKTHQDLLSKKSLGLYIMCTMTEEQIALAGGKEKVARHYLQAESLSQFALYEFLGGKRCYEKLDPIDKMTLTIGKKKYPKIDIEDFDRIEEPKIRVFTDRIVSAGI